MTPLRLPLMLAVICFLPTTATRADAALITWLEGVDPGFTVTRGNSSWILEEGIRPGRLPLDGSGDDDRGHDGGESARVHGGIPPGLLGPHPTGGSETGKNTGRGHTRDEEGVSDETPPLIDVVDFDDLPGLVDDVDLLEGGLETPDLNEDLVLLHPDGDDPSSAGSSRDDATELASVPEPSSMLLLMSAGVAWATRSRHRRRQRD